MAHKTKKPPHPLYLNPEGKLGDFDFGVLRTNYNGRENSVLAYARGKLELCARSEVLLPADAHDALADSTEIWRNYEAARLSGQRDLATCVTLYLPGTRTLHGVWEEVRCFARDQFVEAHGLPVLVVLHAPGLAGSPHAPHAHLMVAARRLHAWGWGEFSELCCDRAQGEIYTAWTAHRRAWRRDETARAILLAGQAAAATSAKMTGGSPRWRRAS